MDVPTPPELELRPLSQSLKDAPALWTRRPAAETVDRFVAEQLIRRDEVDFIYENVFRQLALITVGGGLVVAGGWTTYLLSGGMRGIWTKHRDWGAVGMGIPTAFFLGSLISQFAGKMWVAEELYHRMPEKVGQNLLIYRYAQAAIPSSLPPVGSGPLFDEAGQARFAFTGQQALLEGEVQSAEPLAIGQDGKSLIGQLAKSTWSRATERWEQKAAGAGGDLLVPSTAAAAAAAAAGSDPAAVEADEKKSWAETWASIKETPGRLRAGYRDLLDDSTADPLGQLNGGTPSTDGEAPVV